MATLHAADTSALSGQINSAAFTRFRFVLRKHLRMKWLFSDCLWSFHVAFNFTVKSGPFLMDFIKQIKASFKKWKKNKKQTEVKASRWESFGSQFLSQEITRSWLRKEAGQADGGDDYVKEEEIEFKISCLRYEFYKCEMPSEALARIKARQDSLSRMHGVPLGLKPFCSLRLWEREQNTRTSFN